MYYLALISDDAKQIDLCKKVFNSQEYLVTAISWSELIDHEDRIRKADVAIVDLLNPSLNVNACLTDLQRELKLYETEVYLLLLLHPAALEQLALFKGFEDFLLSPIIQKELLVRLELILRRQGKGKHDQIIQINDLVIDLEKYEVRKAGQPLDLTFKEYELLKYLIAHKGRVFPREALLNAVWGYGYYGGTRTVYVHIRRIRAKIGDEEEHYIKTVWGVGYSFVSGG